MAENGGGFENRATALPAVPIDFPNIAHSYWSHYRLTGSYYVRPSKLSV
jgi:hypothetical protein